MRDVAFISSHLWLFSYLFSVVWETLSAVWFQDIVAATASVVHGVHLAAIGSAVWVVIAYWLVSVLSGSKHWVATAAIVDVGGFIAALMAVSVLTDIMTTALLLGERVGTLSVVLDAAGYSLVGVAGLAVTYLTLYAEPVLE
jgi:hypothetical protein